MSEKYDAIILKRLHADHESAVLAFDLANRAYFAASVSAATHEGTAEAR